MMPGRRATGLQHSASLETRVVSDVRVNLGCGLNAPDGWINIDRSISLTLDRLAPLKSLLYRIGLLQDEHMVDWPRNIRRIDARKGLPFARGSVAAIYSSHMLEHLYLDEARDVMRECRRILHGGGRIRLALPDAEVWARRLLEGGGDGTTDPGLEFNKQLKAYPFQPPTLRDRLLDLVRASPHRWQPTSSLVKTLLLEAGFSDVTEQEFLRGDFPDLASVEHRSESLFIQGVA